MQVPVAGNVYESYSRFPEIVATQVRMKIGEVQIHLLLNDIRRQLAENPEMSLAAVIGEDIPTGRQWLAELVQNHVEQGGWWLMFPGALSNRLRWFSRSPLASRLRNLPVALVGTAADLVFSFLANRKLKQCPQNGWWTHFRPVTPALPVALTSAEFDRTPIDELTEVEAKSC